VDVRRSEVDGRRPVSRHMIEEHARPNRRADLVREWIDGVTGA
jgi:hypothetical protein